MPEEIYFFHVDLYLLVLRHGLSDPLGHGCVVAVVNWTGCGWEGAVFYQVDAVADGQLVTLEISMLTWSSCGLDFETEI